jgi:hypothetical protein
VVLPQTSEHDSKESRVMGTFVLTNGYAPASRSSRTIAASFEKGAIQRGEEYPMHEAKPAMPTVSFRLTGIPARGPALLQVLCKRLCLRYHDLGKTIRLFMGIESLLAVSKQYFLRVDVAALNIRDQ